MQINNTFYNIKEGLLSKPIDNHLAYYTVPSKHRLDLPYLDRITSLSDDMFKTLSQSQAHSLKQYIVWADGKEVTDRLVTIGMANELIRDYTLQGYTDVKKEKRL